MEKGRKRRTSSRMTSAYPLISALPALQHQPVGDHGDELRIGRLSAVVLNGVAEIGVERIYLPPNAHLNEARQPSAKGRFSVSLILYLSFLKFSKLSFQLIYTIFIAALGNNNFHIHHFGKNLFRSCGLQAEKLGNIGTLG